MLEQCEVPLAGATSGPLKQFAGGHTPSKSIPSLPVDQVPRVSPGACPQSPLGWLAFRLRHFLGRPRCCRPQDSCLAAGRGPQAAGANRPPGVGPASPVQGRVLCVPLRRGAGHSPGWPPALPPCPSPVGGGSCLGPV